MNTKILYRDQNSYQKLHAIHTASEIYNQSKVWKNTIRIFKDNKANIQSFLKSSDVTHATVIFTGAGTSEFIGNTAVPYLHELGYTNTYSYATTELISNPYSCLHKDDNIILVSFARSGDSPESLAVVQLVENIVKTCYHIVITCNKNGALLQYCSQQKNCLVISLDGANDKGFAMTSSFTSMLISSVLLFHLSSLQSFEDDIKQSSDFFEDWILKNKPVVLDLVRLKYNRIVCLGSGFLNGIAQEAHLKILELSASLATAFYNNALGFRHGPKSLLNDRTLVFVMVSPDTYAQQYDIDIIKELFKEDKKIKIVALLPNIIEEISENTHYAILSPSVKFNNSIFYGIFYIVLAQIFALENSISLGITPDNPSPSGSVNRVVKGVTIYPFER